MSEVPAFGSELPTLSKVPTQTSAVLTPTWTTKAVLNLTLQINNLTTLLPSCLVKMLGHSLDAVMPPNHRSSPNPKMKFKRDRDKQIQVISSNHTNKHIGHKDLSQGSATPQRSSYVLVVEVTTKVEVYSTSLPPSKRPQRSLELSTKKSKGNTNFPRLFHKMEALGQCLAS